jgi:4-amino-4-deoxy-L-arabinose transferase-like glycosyltransferase
VLGRLRGEGWGHAIRVLAPLGALIVEGWPACIGALLVQEGGLWLASRLADACHRTVRRRLFLAAYGLRVAIVLPTHYIAKLSDGNGALFSDDYTNDLVGEWLGRIARGEGIAIFPGHQHLLDSIYTYFLMGIYAVFGYTPVLPKLVNSGLAALSAVIVFDLARRTFRLPAAILAAIGAAVLPTIIVWSVASLKETLVLFVTLLALRMVQFLIEAPARSPRIGDALVALVALLALLLDLRSTSVAILVGVLLIVWAVRSHVPPRVRSWQVAVASLAVLVLLGGGVWFRARSSNRPPGAVFEDAMLQLRHRRAQEAASARSQLRPEVDGLTPNGSELPEAELASDNEPFSIVGDIVDPLGYALLAPAPWQAHGLSELGASAEMTVWYVLLVTSFLAWRAEPRQRLFVVCLAVYAVANWLVLAASEGNLGNLLRHRLTLDPSLLILGSAGLDWMWVRAGRPFGTFRRTPLRMSAARSDS